MYPLIFILLLQMSHAASVDTPMPKTIPDPLRFTQNREPGRPEGMTAGLAKRTAADLPATLSTRFNSGGPNFPIHSFAGSGKDLYIGGGFSAVGSKTFSGIAKWDGNQWTGLGAGLPGMITHMAISENAVIAAAMITLPNSNLESSYLSRWDGLAWTPFEYRKVGGPVSALANSGSDIYVGFSKESQINHDEVIKWDGSVWSNLGEASDSNITCLKAVPGSLYAGGDFRHIGGVDAQGVAVWNGSEWKALGAGLKGRVEAMEVLGSRVFAAGHFRIGSDTTYRVLAIWEGSEWMPVELEPGSKLPGQVSLTVDETTGKVYFSGRFQNPESISSRDLYEFRVYQWHQGNLSRLGPVLDRSLSGTPVGPLALAVYQGKPIVGGDFSRAGQVLAQGLAVWDGSAWSEWPQESGLGVNKTVVCLALQGKTLIAGGIFSRAAGRLVKGPVAFDGNGWSDLALPSPFVDGYGATALAIDGETLYGAGSGVYRKRDGSWTLLSKDSDYGIIEIYPKDGGLYAAGFFDSIGGTDARNIAHWDGQAWHALGKGLNGPCFALEWDDGYLYAGGEFDSAGGIRVAGIARWDGKEWSILGTQKAYGYGVGGISKPWVSRIRKQGNRLLVGGGFSNAGGITTYNIASWSSQGWSGMGNTYQYGAVTDLAIKNDSVFFLAYDLGNSRPGKSGVAMWTGKEWRKLETDIQMLGWGELQTAGVVNTLALSGNTLYAGGHFNMVGGVPSSFIAQWDLDESSGLVRSGPSQRFSGNQRILLENASRSDFRFLRESNPGARFFDARGKLLHQRH